MGCISGKPEDKANGDDTSQTSVKKPEGTRLLDKYSLGKILGQGAFGVVYICKRKDNMEEFAVKMVDQVETPLSEIKMEVEYLQNLMHPCIVKLHDVYYEKVFVCMVLDLCRGGDMIEGMQLHWKFKGMIPLLVVQNMSKMMFQSVDWLHQQNVVHRDLKGDNFLQDRKNMEHPQCRIYLSDFGTVTTIKPNDRLRQKCGTKTYWSPEFFALNYNLKVDVWALGVVIFGMITGRFPFKGEEDVKNKVIKIPARCGREGEVCLLGMLSRSEGKRLSARDVLQQPWLASIKSSAEIAEPIDQDFKPEVRELPPNSGIRERRAELVERLENAQACTRQATKSQHMTSFSNAEFKVHNRTTDTFTTFQWLSTARFAEGKYIDKENAQVLKTSDLELMMETSTAAVKQMLTAHKISTTDFGKDQAKTIEEFVKEINRGQARLMLDASKHKSLVRVVDVVLFRLLYRPKSGELCLVIDAEKFPDGRLRQNINQLPGCKKMPYENSAQAIRRIIRERLNMSSCEVSIECDFLVKECYEEEENSPSYPGVRTVYRKAIFEGILKETNMSILEKRGLGTKRDLVFNHTDPTGYTRYCKWMTKDHLSKFKVRARAPTEGADLSALVHPPTGFDEDELKQFLHGNNIDTGKFGKDGVRSLAEFSEELIGGQAALVKENGVLTRVVDVLVLELKKANGDTVVEVVDSKTDKETSRLPAVKRRQDENVFWAAHRVLDKVLRVNENVVQFDHETVLQIKQKTQSPSYGGLPTFYQRIIVSGKVVEGPNM